MTEDTCTWIVEYLWKWIPDDERGEHILGGPRWRNWMPNHQYNLDRAVQVLIDTYGNGESQFGSFRIRNFCTGEIIPLEALGI